MISKYTFVGVINNIREQEKKAADFTKALNLYCDGHPIFDTDNLYLKALLDLLEEVFQDEYGTIKWWLWEDVEKKIWINYGQENQVEIDVSTPELLYDYLIAEINNTNTLERNKLDTTESEES
jgi:hypothetical protein